MCSNNISVVSSSKQYDRSAKLAILWIIWFAKANKIIQQHLNVFYSLIESVTLGKTGYNYYCPPFPYSRMIFN